MTTLFPRGADPVEAMVKSDGTTEAHNERHGRTEDIGVNVLAVGAKGDGTTDDSSAIQDAIDEAEETQIPLIIPSGRVYGVRTPLTLPAVSGFVVNGGGAGGVTTPRGAIIKALESMDYVMAVGCTFSHLRDFRIDGNDNATHGILVYNAARTHFDTLGANNCAGNGIHIQDNAESFGLTNGNNNSALFTKVTAVNNTGHGIFMEESNDNNIIQFIHPTATGNGGDGIVLKASGAVLIGGHFEGNTGYGIRVGEADDSGTQIGAKIYFPWLEGNTAGGIVFTDGKASGCEYWEITAGMQDVDFANSWDRNFIYTVSSSPHLRHQYNGDGRGIAFNFESITVNDSSAVDTDRDLTITTKGTGRVITSGGAKVTGDVELDGAINHDGTTVGFYGVTPATRPTAYTQTYSTADKTHAAPTAATLTVADGAGTNDNTIGAITADASVIAAVQEIADEINKLVADVADTKQLVNSVIDDLQTLGLLQ